MCSPRTWGLHHEQDTALCPLQQPQHRPIAPLFSGMCKEEKLGDVRGYDIQPQQGLQSRSSIPSTSSILFQPINILSNFPFCSYIYIRRGRTAQESSSFSPHGSEPFHWNGSKTTQQKPPKAHSPNHKTLTTIADTILCYLSLLLSRSQYFNVHATDSVLTPRSYSTRVYP